MNELHELPLVVAVDHPSLDGQLQALLGELRAESRRFGPRSMHAPKPFPSLIRKLDDPSASRLGALSGGRMVGLVATSDGGEIAVAVVADVRRSGIGKMLLASALERARLSGHRRLTLATSRRSRAMSAIASSEGWITVDRGRGRVDLIIDLTQHAQSA